MARVHFLGKAPSALAVIENVDYFGFVLPKWLLLAAQFWLFSHATINECELRAASKARMANLRRDSARRS
jgi:hypothetical protein